MFDSRWRRNSNTKPANINKNNLVAPRGTDRSSIAAVAVRPAPCRAAGPRGLGRPETPPGARTAPERRSGPVEGTEVPAEWHSGTLPGPGWGCSRTVRGRGLRAARSGRGSRAVDDPSAKKLDRCRGPSFNRSQNALRCRRDRRDCPVRLMLRCVRPRCRLRPASPRCRLGCFPGRAGSARSWGRV